MAIEWMSVKSGTKPTQDIRIAIQSNGINLHIMISKGAWITKLKRADRLAVGFETSNGVPTRMFLAPSGSGYRVNQATEGSTPYIRILVGKLNTAYPRMKVSELQGDYVLRLDESAGCHYISLGAKSY